MVESGDEGPVVMGEYGGKVATSKEVCGDGGGGSMEGGGWGSGKRCGAEEVLKVIVRGLK